MARRVRIPDLNRTDPSGAGPARAAARARFVMKGPQTMKRPRYLLALAAVSAAASLPIGCSPNDPDRTGDSTTGIGTAGTNATNLPQSREEERKQQLEQEAAFRKTRR